jgi:hypothetical protein
VVDVKTETFPWREVASHTYVAAGEGMPNRVLDDNPQIHAVLADVRRCLHQGLDVPKQFGHVTLDVAIADSIVKGWDPVFIPHFTMTDLTRRRAAG